MSDVVSQPRQLEAGGCRRRARRPIGADLFLDRLAYLKNDHRGSDRGVSAREELDDEWMKVLDSVVGVISDTEPALFCLVT
jgi:hypothetical protein